MMRMPDGHGRVELSRFQRRLRSHGAELVGEIAQHEEIYRLCFTCWKPY